MIPLESKCYVQGKGVGKVEAICNNKPKGGVSWSYCVRLRSEPDKIQWFEEDEVTHYDEPIRKRSDSKENQGKTKDSSSREEA